MQIHQSAEDYLETILMLSQRMGKVRSIDVVNELGFTKASVSIAMKKLRENGYIAVDGEGNLTDSGKKPADFVAAEAGKRLMTDAEGEKLAGVSEGATKTAASSTNGNVNIDGKEVVVYTEPENVLHDEDVEDFSAEEIAALLADAD